VFLLGRLTPQKVIAGNLIKNSSFLGRSQTTGKQEFFFEKSRKKKFFYPPKKSKKSFFFPPKKSLLGKKAIENFFIVFFSRPKTGLPDGLFSNQTSQFG
jgi:hypothetical protein